MFATRLKRALVIFIKLPRYALAIPIVMVVRLIRPWFLIRFGDLLSHRIGHFAANTELYLCGRDAGINLPERHHVDLFHMVKPISNPQLATMWKRVLRVWPIWLLAPIRRVNRLIPGWEIHEVDNTLAWDIHSHLDKFPPHLEFTPEEEAKGEVGLHAMGIPPNTPFVCLIVRDSAYLDTHLQGNWSYHDYRDTDIQNYVLAAEELAERGYYVIRMGAKVHEAMRTTHTMIIDYAANGMRSDFMDIYLGAKCAFCISTGTGWDEIPEMTRRPIVYVNYPILGRLHVSRSNFLSIVMKYALQDSQKILTSQEIFSLGVGFSGDGRVFESKGVQRIENTPEEIRDVVIEMSERLNGSWQSHEDDEILQNIFWEKFPVDAKDPLLGLHLHGEICGRLGAAFLRNNRDWLL